jgi:deoxyadenosine/deoxycytidine kinase
MRFELRELSTAGTPLALAIEGNIGAGKTELLRKMKENFQELIHVHEENADLALLGLFYTDPAKYGCLMQCVMLQRRIGQWKEGQYNRLYELLSVLWDRSMIGDFMFCTFNWMLGRINDEEYAVYASWFEAQFSTLAQSKYVQGMSHVVFLSDTPAACKARADSREIINKTGNLSHPAPLWYFEGLDDIHFDQALRLAAAGANVRVIEWGNYDAAEDVIEYVVQEGFRPTVLLLDNAKVGWQPDLPAHSVRIAYNDPSDLERPLPWRAMGLGGFTVSANLEAHRRPCPEAIQTDRQVIGFFTEAFKRRIMHHMTLGDHITLCGKLSALEVWGAGSQ